MVRDVVPSKCCINNVYKPVERLEIPKLLFPFECSNTSLPKIFVAVTERISLAPSILILLSAGFGKTRIASVISTQISI